MQKVLFSTRTYHMLRIPLLLMLGLALLSVLAYGQETANIIGTVTDPTGASVPSAKITVISVETGFVRSMTANSTGSFSASELPPGHYNVRVEAPGFKAYEQTGVVLNVHDTVSVDARLQVGAVTENVTVEANAIAVQAENNEVSQTVTANQITDLATNGRNIIQLAALVPGASSGIPDFDTPMAQTQNRSIEFNGQRSDHNDWIINGGEAYDRGGGGIMLVSPSQDSIAEFKILTSNYSADLGLASGGMIVMSTKSGTKQFHGTLFEYIRNNDLDANPFFSNLYNQGRPELRYNTFGFNLGGPVPIKKDTKTFFFYNMEWRRLVNGNAISAAAVPRAETTGDFSGWNGTLKVPNVGDPAEIAKFATYGLTPGQPFPNNKIPAGLLDSNASAVLAAGLFPGPNTSAGTYYTSANQLVNYREENARIDHQIGDKLSLMASLIYDNGSEQDLPPLWSGGTYGTAGSIMAVPSWAGVVHATYTISPTLLNEAAFNLNGNNINITDVGLWAKPSGYNVPNLFGSNTADKLPSFFVGAPYYLYYSPGWWPWYNTWRSWQGKDDISWMHGRHNVKLGASYLFTHKWQQYQSNAGGGFSFGNQTGNSFADFMLGIAGSYSEPANVGFVNISNNTFSVYGMDDWRVSDRLTINLGVRWEGLPHAYDSNNNASDFYPSRYSAAQAAQFLPSGALNTAGPGFTTVASSPLPNQPFYMNGVGMAGQNGVPSGLVSNSWDTFAPRIGFAFDLTGHQKTILRAGSGMFYERLGGNEMYNLIQNSVPFAYSSSPNNVYLDNPAQTWTTGLSAGASPYFPAGIWALDKGYKVPTSLQWSFGIQQQLTQNAVVSVSYVGNSNFHQSEGININTIDPANTAARMAVCGSVCGYTGVPANSNLYRPYRGWGTIDDMEMGATSNYNSLQVSFRTMEWKGLTVQESYTWSHSFDIIDGELFAAINNPFNASWDYGPAGWDRRQMSITSFVYKFPFFKDSANHLARGVVGGWTLSGIWTLESGTPMSIGSANDNLGLGGGTGNRANITSPITYPGTRFQWFSTSSFAEPAALQWGTAAKNDVVGPGRNNWNIALYKAFQFTERARVEFRVESFNTFNHTQWQNPNTSLGGTQFGQITGTYEPRIFQFGAKFLF